MGGCGSRLSACLLVPVCESGLWVSWVGGGDAEGGACVGGGGTQHSEGGRGERTWQVEVRAEQFSTVGVEMQRGYGGQGWGRSVKGD